MAGLYIHIPFCRQACYYCDFHFSTNVRYIEQMVGAICNELSLQRSYLKNELLDTIYYGGGTPSILSVSQIDKILSVVHKHFSTNDNPEITLEANPDDLNRNKLKNLNALGINRLSIGIQSFENKTLKFLNRIHDSKRAEESFLNAREVGFDNISIDLIFSIPGQGLSELGNDLNAALVLNPEHISIYNLTIEEKTVFGNWAKRKKILEVSDEESAQHYELIMNVLEDAGYEHYEISNFCRHEHYSRHNTAYWSDKAYLGVGPGAHSYNGKDRQFNVSNNHKYLKALAKGIVPYQLDELDQKAMANDYLLTSLRTKWGCDLNKLSIELKYPVLKLQGKRMSKYVKSGLIRIDDERIYLTRKGKFLADEIISDLFWI